MSNDERLHRCEILSHENGRLRSDLILVFKITKGFVNVEEDKFFQLLEDPRTTFESVNRPAG